MSSLRRQAIGIALVMLASALWLSVYQQHPRVASLFDGATLLLWTVAGVLFAAALLLLLTSFDQGRSTAAVRLDWFLPALRKLQPDQRPSHTMLGRGLRRVLPRNWQSEHTTKKRGWLRKTIRRLGPSWSASPVRRGVQTVSLLTFLTLFFYVCWPYSARPTAPGESSRGWSFAEIDQVSGEIRLSKTASVSWSPETGDKVFLVTEGQAASTLGAFIVTGTQVAEIRLLAAAELTPELLEALYTGTDLWSVYQREPHAWPAHYAENLARKELIPAELFLVIDPLVSLSTAIASRSWVWSLAFAGVILIVCVLVPRGFCGYLCPLGTTIDLFDWLIGNRVERFRVSQEGWWVHVKYYLLAGTLLAAVCGVLVSGYFAAIPVITRGMLFLVDPIQNGLARGWHLVPPMEAGQLISLLLFAAVLMLGLLRPRFWCKYVCPSGAVFSLGNLFRATERKVEASCIHCNKCVEICPFDAIKPDFTTRVTDCTLCQSCGGVCPTHAIKFVERWNLVDLKVTDDPPTGETSLGRRGFLSLAAGTTAAAVGGIGIASATKVFGANLNDPRAFLPVRPPGSVPEAEFLELCIRCGECFKACPNNVLQPEGLQQGLEGLWTPMVKADWAGCESSCNACGQVCPTGAIRPLPLEEKRFARMGLAIVDESSCLPFAGQEDCDLCVQECDAAGYQAIEYLQVGTQTDTDGQPIEGSGYLAPRVLPEMCVGCGLCQTRCYAINVKERHVLSESAVIVEAGEGREDRLRSGSYKEAAKLRQHPPASESQSPSKGNFFVPGSDADAQPDSNDAADPFGIDAELPAEGPVNSSDSPF